MNRAYGDDDSIRPANLFSLYKAGFKLLPLSKENKEALQWTPIHDNPDYWSLEKLMSQRSMFKNVSTVFGKSHLKDPKGEALYIHCLDIDSQNVHRILSAPLNDYGEQAIEKVIAVISKPAENLHTKRVDARTVSLLEILKQDTFVVKTKKPHGYHAYWFEPSLHKAVHTVDCKPGSEFELKTDRTSGHATLPPSRHRHDPSFKYQSIGRDRIAIIPGFYDLLTRSLLADCIVAEKTSNNATSQTARVMTGRTKPSHRQTFRSLSTHETDAIATTVLPFYTEGIRDQIAFGLSGLLFKEGVALESAVELFSSICDSAGDSEKKSRLQVLRDTYAKGADGEEIAGSTWLTQSIRSVAGSEQTGNDITTKIRRILAGKNTHEKKSRLPNSEDEREVEDYDDGDDDEREQEKKNNKAKKALELAVANSKELFLDEFGRAFAAMRVDDHVEVHPMDERRFKNWISGLYYKEEDDLLSEEDLKKIVRILEATAEYDTSIPRCRLDVRVRGFNNELPEQFQSSSQVSEEGADEEDEIENFTQIYYDLTNRCWGAVELTVEGWSIDKSPPTLFRRYGSETAQCNPAEPQSSPPDTLDKFLALFNLKKDNEGIYKLLLKAYIPSLFWPNTIPKPVLMLPAAHGSAKTTMFELIKDLVDPNITKTASLPRESFNLKQYMAHNYTSFFDNVSYISDEQSDILCRAVTGSGDMKRKLYENDEDVIYRYRRIIGLNGITNAATRPDLLDRGLIIELGEIKKQDRKLLRKIKRDYRKLKPQLLSFCLDVVVEVMKERQKWRGVDDDLFGVKIANGLPRMADWAILAEQISAKVAEKEGKSYAPGTFLEAFDENLKALNTEALKESVVAEAMISFMTAREVKKTGIDKTDGLAHWEGTPTKLLADLEEFITANHDIKINISKKPWPQEPSQIGKEIARISTNLASVGIAITKKRTSSNIFLEITKRPTYHTHPTQEEKICSDNGQIDVGTNVGDPATVPTGEKGGNHAQDRDDVGSAGHVGKFEKSVSDSSANSHAASVLGDNHAAFDLEYSPDDKDPVIYAGAIVDSKGNSKVLHASDFGDSEAELVQAIIDEIRKYPVTVGWGTTIISESSSTPMNEGTGGDSI